MIRAEDINVGDRFVQVWPPRNEMLEVESLLSDGKVAVRRLNGARQTFPSETLANAAYWLRTYAAASGEEGPRA